MESPSERMTTLSEPHPPAVDDGWRWWGGSSEEWCTIGPFRTRDEVIAAAIDQRMGEAQRDDGTWTVSVHVCEARQDPLRLADWIGLENLLERADEELADSDRVGSENDEGPWFEATPEQKRDLVERIKAVCDAWQAAHGLVFTARTFSDSRNLEHVVVPLPGEGIADE